MDKTKEATCENEIKEFLFFGAPLLDITAHCDQNTLDKYGLKLDDCIQETSRQKSLFRTLFANPENQRIAGGSSQNSARIAKWILRERGRVSFAGCVGEDEYSKSMLECLKSEGVEPIYISLPDVSTGVCACLLGSDGNRSMIARLDAAKHFTAQHLQEENIQERIQKAHCIFVEGYFFGHSPDVILSLAERCSSKQVFSISVSAEYICTDYSDILQRVLPRVDVFFSNEAEAKVLAHTWKLGDTSISVEDIASILSVRERPPEHKPRIVIITRGPKPVLVARGNDPVLSFSVPSVKVVDGVGCGDALAGAFLAVYVLTEDIYQAAKTGIAAASEIAQVTGCKPTEKKFVL